MPPPSPVHRLVAPPACSAASPSPGWRCCSPTPLVWSPADLEMQDTVRLMYVHVPTAILAYAGRGHHHAGLGDVAPAPHRGLVGARRRRRRGRHGVHRHRPGHRIDLGPSHLGHLLAVGPRITSTTLLFIMLVGVQALRAHRQRGR